MCADGTCVSVGTGSLNEHSCPGPAVACCALPAAGRQPPAAAVAHRTAAAAVPSTAQHAHRKQPRKPTRRDAEHGHPQPAELLHQRRRPRELRVGQLRQRGARREEGLELAGLEAELLPLRVGVAAADHADARKRDKARLGGGGGGRLAGRARVLAAVCSGAIIGSNSARAPEKRATTGPTQVKRVCFGSHCHGRGVVLASGFPKVVSASPRGAAADLLSKAL